MLPLFRQGLDLLRLQDSWLALSKDGRALAFAGQQRHLLVL